MQHKHTYIPHILILCSFSHAGIDWWSKEVKLSGLILHAHSYGCRDTPSETQYQRHTLRDTPIVYNADTFLWERSHPGKINSNTPPVHLLHPPVRAPWSTTTPTCQPTLSPTCLPSLAGQTLYQMQAGKGLVKFDWLFCSRYPRKLWMTCVIPTPSIVPPTLV